MANLIKDPEGPRLARIEYTAFGFPTGRLFLSDLRFDQVRATSVAHYFRYENDLYLRVRVLHEPEPTSPESPSP